jgi:hypothetical protein
VELTQQLDPADTAKYKTYKYLTRTLLPLVNDSSSSLVQIQALQQVLAWLLQLPAGDGRKMVFNMLTCSDGWVQWLLQCWVAEVQATGCQVHQAAAASSVCYAAAFSGAAAAAAAGDDSSRGIGGYLAGLCQLLLHVLAECCKNAAAAAAGNPADGAVQAGVVHLQQPLQAIAGDLLAGTAALLLKDSTSIGTHPQQQQQQQQRCALAGLWRNCLWMSLSCFKDGQGQLEVVAEEVLHLSTTLLAELP